MTTLKHLSIAMAVVAAVSLVMSGVGFSSMAAERGVQVNVVSDDEAYVGYNSTDETGVRSGDEISIVEVTNRVGNDLSVTEVDVTSSNGDVEVTPSETLPSVDPGESKAVTGEVETCEWGSSATIIATITVEGEGLSATIFGGGETVDRSFTVECESPVDSVEFSGSGDATLDGPADRAVLNVVMLDKRDNSTDEVTENLAVGTGLRSQLDVTPKRYAIVGVGVEGDTSYYVHPQFNATDCTIDDLEKGGTVSDTEKAPFETCP